jgi:hypothetical protein
MTEAAMLGAPVCRGFECEPGRPDVYTGQRWVEPRAIRLDCALEAYDAEGKPVNTLGRALAFNFSLQQYQPFEATGSAVPVRLALDLPAGGVALRVMVYDPASARTGSVGIPVQVLGT